MSDHRRAGRLVVPSQQAPADKALLERSAIEELSHHADPWRVLRILSEFVEGFDALGEVGPAVTGFGSARSKPDDPYYEDGAKLGAALARRGLAVITGGGPGIIEWMKEVVVAAGAIGAEDLNLLSFTDDPEEAAEMATRPLPLKVQVPREQTGQPKRDV